MVVTVRALPGSLRATSAAASVRPSRAVALWRCGVSIVRAFGPWRRVPGSGPSLVPPAFLLRSPSSAIQLDHRMHSYVFRDQVVREAACLS